MGWHTLKRQKSSQKEQQKLMQQQQLKHQQQQQQQTLYNNEITTIQQKIDKERNLKNLTVNTAITNDFQGDDSTVETLLARAVYDNQSDAPDELTIRKGDIVTVIEKDIDGLTGWWLCLLHGQQGIVPGNRLKVIPPVELDLFEKTSENGGNFTTGPEFAADGDNYDYLPNPVKTPAFVPTLSIKDMFDIPFKTNADNKEVYDVPNSLNNNKEIYDIPSNKEKTDISSSRSSGYDSPKMSSAGNLTSNNGPMETYDVPSSLQNLSSVDHLKSNNGPLETYDVPSSLQNLSTLGRGKSPRTKQQQQPQKYSVPSSLPNLTSENFQYRRMKSKSDLEVDQLMDNIMDSPFNEEPNVSTIKRSPLSSNNSTPRSSYTSVANANSDNSISIINGTQEIYDVPKKDTLQVSGGSTQKYEPSFQKKNLHLQSPITNSLSHTLPRGFRPRGNNFNKLQGKPPPTRLQEIYDIPSTTIVANRSLPGTPVTSRKPMQADVQTTSSHQEIYDVPAPRTHHQDPITNPEFMIMLHQLERQESFSSQKRDSTGSLSKWSSMGSASKRESRDSFYTPPQSRDSSEFYDIPTHRSPRNSSQYMMNNSLNHENKQEVYDVPPSKGNVTSAHELYDTPPVRKTETLDRRSNSNIHNDVCDGEELYNVPPYQTSTPRTQELLPHQEVYDILPTTKKQHEPPVQQDVYDVPPSYNINQVMADAAYKSHKVHRNHNNNNNNNNGLLTTSDAPEDDYVDYHDIWTNEPPKELLSLHDKHTGDKLTPDGSPSLARKRLSSTGSSSAKKSILDQINFEAVKELQLSVTEAVDRLTKLHLAVDTCVQTMRCFCIDNWLDISVLKSTISSIRDFSGKLKTALRLLTEFGLGTLVNTTNNINGEALMDKIIGDVEPLLESYYKVKICLMHLDAREWVVPEMRDSSTDKFFATLNAIMILSQRIPDQCRAFVTAVRNNATELFPSESTVKTTTQQVEDLKPISERPPQQLSSPQQQQRPFPKGKPIGEPVMSAETLRRELAGRRQQARDVTLRPMPRIPPKPNLPNQRRSLAGVMETAVVTPRVSLAGRTGASHIERLVTEYQPDNSRQKKYASDPTTPSHNDAHRTLWGGSCPILLDRNSAAAASPLHQVDSISSSSSVGASIPEETIEIKQTTTATTESDKVTKNYPSDSNLQTPVLTPMHTRSASVPWDDKLKNVFAYDDTGPKSPGLSPLDHRDIESLEFFCRQVESQVLLLRESMKNLTDAVENREEPVVFVSHSKFIILTAHKVVHSGQEISERLINEVIKSKIKQDTTHLTICIRGVVSATKAAALEFPEPNYLMEMISSVLALGDAVRIIHSECRRALEV